MLDRSFWRERKVFLTGHTGFPTAEQNELPKTASNMPVLGMMGLLSLVAAFVSKLLTLERTDR